MSEKTINPFCDIPYAEQNAPGSRYGSDYIQDLRELKVGGNGATVFKADNQGIWAGADKFIDALFSVSVGGVLKALSGIFSGTLNAASGTFGTITGGIITGVDVFASYFGYLKNTIIFPLGSADGWNGDPADAAFAITHYASNQLKLLLASATEITRYIQVGGSSILLNSNTSVAVRWDKNPRFEFWGKLNIAGTEPTVEVRLGPVNVDNLPFFGWKFSYDTSYSRVITSYYDNSLHEGIYLTGNADQWHKYKIQVTCTSADHYTAKWFIDDLEKESHDISVAIANPSYFKGYKLKNNIADILKIPSIEIAHAIFQQDY